MGSLVRDVVAIGRSLLGTLKHAAEPATTVQYPEERRPLYPRARWRHELLRHEDGRERCVGCALCAAVCPSRAIHVEAAESSDLRRYAKVYEVNLARCIFCGHCQEACPVQAIVLGSDYEIADFTRRDVIYTKDRLLVPDPRPKGRTR